MDAVINGEKGEYYGEFSKAHAVLQGRGVFVSESKLILGSFKAGQPARDHKSIVANIQTLSIVVYSGSVQSRPHGTAFGIGFQYQEDGFVASGLFDGGDKLVIPLQLKLVASRDFLDIGKDLINTDQDLGPTYVKSSVIEETESDFMEDVFI